MGPSAKIAAAAPDSFTKPTPIGMRERMPEAACIALAAVVPLMVV